MRALVAFVLVLVTTVAAPRPAAAFDLTYQSGPIDKWPGRLLVGISPVGVMGGFGGSNPTIWYHAGIDVAYQVYTLAKDVDLWIGAGLGYGITAGWGTPSGMNPCALTRDSSGTHYVCPNVSGPDVGMYSTVNTIELNAFAMVTFNTLVFPLVPYARAGAGGNLLLEDTGTVAAGGVRLGGGADYWLFKQLAIGLDVNFQLGGANGPAGGGFFGFWNASLGVRMVL